MYKLLLLPVLIVALALGSCGGQKEDEIPPPLAGGGSGGGGNNFTGMIMGKISFEGTAPPNEKIKMSGDAKCPADSGVTNEAFMVSEGGLENVIVYVSGGLEGKSFAVTKTPVEIDQHGCHYVPHVLTIQAGQPLSIKNSDDTLHNIHAWADKNTPFNESEAKQGMVIEKKFTTEEIPLRIACDVHKWMQAWAGVFKHPLHAVSGKGGEFKIMAPPGKYEVTAWHEMYPEKTQKAMVEVAEGANAMGHVNFTFKASEAKAN